jgi:hypothetical protein
VEVGHAQSVAHLTWPDTPTPPASAARRTQTRTHLCPASSMRRAMNCPNVPKPTMPMVRAWLCDGCCVMHECSRAAAEQAARQSELISWLPSAFHRGSHSVALLMMMRGLRPSVNC